jgi:phosphoribosylamine--glycine ligase
MKVLIVGSGGREHAIAAAFSRSEHIPLVFCAPGNAGIAEVAECVDISADDINALADLAEKNAIDLTFVGGESPLALGIADEFASRGLRIVGVSKAAARLEASKSFAKDLMRRHNIPTAKYKTAASPAEALAILDSGYFGDQDSAVVVKADGLAAGKGVVVAEDRSAAFSAINDLAALVGETAASTIVLEECLYGKELSLILFSDGENFALMPPTRDHKRIGEGDTGPNTGGMGTFTDDALLTEDAKNVIVESIVKPTLKGCADEGFPFRGIMFLGLMMTADGPKVLEYNVRFGDPETQSILVRLETDIVDICNAVIDGTLGDLFIEWRNGSSATVVLAAENYPASPRKGDVISGIENAAAMPDISVFHAGTARNENGEFITAGGRVLGITATAETLSEALDKAYAAVEKISWSGMQYRRDIGK